MASSSLGRLPCQGEAESAGRNFFGSRRYKGPGGREEEADGTKLGGRGEERG